MFRKALSESCREHGFPFLEMVSRAYHDSLFISRIAPTGMLFIPAGMVTAIGPMSTLRRKILRGAHLVLAEALAKLCSSSQ